MPKQSPLMSSEALGYEVSVCNMSCFVVELVFD